MNALNNLKTSVKLIGSFLIIAIITAVVGGVGIYYIKQIDAADTYMYENYARPLGLLVDISTTYQRTRINARDMISAKTEEETQKYIDKVDELTAQIDTASAEYASLIQTEKMQAMYDDFDKAHTDYVQHVEEMKALVQDGKKLEAEELLHGEAFAAAQALDDSIQAMETRKVEQAKATSDANTVLANTATTIMITLMLAAVLAGMALGVIISNSIANPLGMVTSMAKSLAVGDMLREMSEGEKDKVRSRKDEIGTIGKAFDELINYMQGMGVAATAIAENDLTTSVTPKSARDELGNSFAKMIGGLREAIGLVADSANAVTAAASQLSTAAEQSGEATNQIATTIQQVALGTAQQTAGVTKTSGSVEQMGRAIDGVA
ncbi:MAG: MCP four helix bundle domain-containing protein, partial [Chloroflexi bacterium]|nr:MCP four helix bundle domain-containing protein [Chloroflexota bacterium]